MTPHHVHIINMEESAMLKRPRAGTGFWALLCISFSLVLGLPQARATGDWLTDFTNSYGNAGSRLDSCSLCHTNIPALNSYGLDMLNQSGSRVQRIVAIELFDSDNDGSNNITEIEALTFPGDSNDFPPPTNQPPTANANGPYSGTVDSAVLFDGSGSSDADGSIVSYSWDFGDGGSATGVSPSHIYTSTGTFNVSLTVTDDGGLSDTAGTSATIGLGNQTPIADPNGPYSGTVGTTIGFDGSGSSDPDGSIVAYSWDFGDGNSGTGINPTHSYAIVGVYNVTLSVVDDAGATDSAGTTASIAEIPNQPPTANANGPYSTTVGVSLSFDGSASFDPDGTILRYDWDFGDDTSAIDAGPSPSHSYGASGNFSVTLTVFDDAGATAMDSTSVSVGNVSNQAPVADANGPYTGTLDSAVQFDGSASFDPDGTIVSYAWDFGDGNSGSGVNPSHSYTVDGQFSVSLSVTDNTGASASDITLATIGVGNQPPTADANGPYNGSVGVAIQFDGTGSADPDGNQLSYAWNFGDGNSGTGPNPSHSYTTAGVYNVSLTVTDSAGASDSSMTTATVIAITEPPIVPVPEDDAEDDRDRNRDDDHDDDDHDDDEDDEDEQDDDRERDHDRDHEDDDEEDDD